MKPNSKTRFTPDQHPDDDPALHYRYDGVDEYGQHWLERMEIDDDGSEIFTEEYIPIRLHARKTEATEDVMPDQWMKDAAEEIAKRFCCDGPYCDDLYDECEKHEKAFAEQNGPCLVAIIARHYAEREKEAASIINSCVNAKADAIKEMGKLAKAIGRKVFRPSTFQTRIEAAAYLHDGKIHTLPAPARHHHLIWVYGDMPGDESGFVTNFGKFVDRERAWKIAQAAEQIIPRDGQIPGTLYSEDVW